MPTSNPYDRRECRDRFAGGETLMSLGAMGEMRPPLSLSLDDLNAMVFSAVARGRQEEADRLRERHGEEMRTAQRRAWAEGREVGAGEARVHTLRRIDELHGSKVRAMVEQLGEALEEDRATKGDLREHIAGAQQLLRWLVDSHHAGFQEVPF